jgi:uncharacterized protein
MLALRPNCELCDVDLPPRAAIARICSYECTFCADCVESILHDVCPNCGGGFVPRPVRPQQEWRNGTGLVNDPPDSRRRSLRYSIEQVSELVRRLQDMAPEER